MNVTSNIEVLGLRRLDNGKLKAFVDLMFDKSYVVRGFRVVEGNEGLFVGFPQQIGKNGKWYNVFLPANDEAKERINEVVLGAYEE